MTYTLDIICTCRLTSSLSLAAYEVLSDSKKRKEYDNQGGNGGNGFHFNGGKARDFHFNFDELFK